MRRWLVVVLLLAGLGVVPIRTATATPGPHPRLLFDSTDVPALQASITSGVPAQAWDKLKFKAEEYLTTVVPGIEQGGQNQMPAYLIDLGLAYVLSGDTRFGRHAIDLMLGLEAANWPVWGSNDGGRDLGNGDLSRGVALAFDWTYGLMTTAERATLVNSLVGQIPPLANNGTKEDVLFSCLDPDWWITGATNNWAGVCAGGNGLLLLAIENELGVPALTAEMTRIRSRVLQHLNWPGRQNYGSNGDGVEGVTYAFYGLKNALPFAFAWQRATGEDILSLNSGLAKIPLWLAYEQYPGKGSLFVPRNDSNSPGLFIHELGPMFFKLRPDGVSGWLWDHTAGPQGDDIFSEAYPPLTNLYVKRADEQWAHLFGTYSPEAFTIMYYRSPAALPRANPSAVTPLSQLYPEHGLVNFRTGFSGTTTDIAGTFEARHNHPGGHSQSDLGSFTLYGYGARFALDSSYTNGGKVGSVQTFDNGVAAGHNVPIIDGQRLTQDGNGSYANVNTIPFYVDAPNATYVRSDLRSAYNAATPAAVPWADRNLYFGRAPGEPVMLAVTDNLSRFTVPKDMSWQMHTDGENAFSPTGTSSFVSIAPNGAAMAGAVADANGTRVIVGYPWQKAMYSVDNPPVHTLVTSRDATARTRMDHLAVLALTPSGSPATPAPLTAVGGSAVSVTFPGGVAYFASAAHGSATVTGPLTLTGAFGKITAGKGESMLDQGTLLAAAGVNYVVASAPSSVIVSGDSVKANGPAGTTYTVYAPQALTSVTVNGASVSFTRVGNLVSF